jgi:hypothetical protein
MMEGEKRKKGGNVKIAEGQAYIDVVRVDTISGEATEEDHVEERVSVRIFATDPAYVGFNAGITKNMGKYESLRLDVRLSLPCYREEIDNTFPLVRDWVDERMGKEMESIPERGEKLL